MSKSEYYMPQADSFIRVEQFNLYFEDDIVDMLLHWFEENHEDPANRCPYDEGEYIYIYGGPVRAEEALLEEFEEIINIETINKALEKIPNRYDDFSLKPDIFWSDYTANDPTCVFNVHIEDIERLNSVHNSNAQLQQKYSSLLFANTVTAFEIFVSDTLIQTIEENKDIRDQFINALNINKTLKTQLIENYEEQKDEVYELVYGITFSNRTKLTKLYAELVNIEFDEIDLGELEKISELRNHVMHRNGKDKRGQPVQMDESTLDWCLVTVRSLVDTINNVEENPFLVYRIEDEPVDIEF